MEGYPHKRPDFLVLVRSYPTRPFETRILHPSGERDPLPALIAASTNVILAISVLAQLGSMVATFTVPYLQLDRFQHLSLSVFRTAVEPLIMSQTGLVASLESLELEFTRMSGRNDREST